METSYSPYMTTAMTMGLTRSAPGVTMALKATIPRTAIRRERCCVNSIPGELHQWAERRARAPLDPRDNGRSELS